MFNSNFKLLFEARQQITPTFGLRLHQNVQDCGINVNSIAKHSNPPIAPWILKAPMFVLTLHLLGSKSEIPPALFIAGFNELLSDYDGYTRIFTDGSKDEKAVGAAAVLGSQVCLKQLPDHSSIFSGEVRAILFGLDMVQQSTRDRFVFCLTHCPVYKAFKVET